MSLGDASVCGNANDPLGLASGRSTYKVYTLVRVMVQALAYQRCNLYNRLEEANDNIACEVKLPTKHTKIHRQWRFSKQMV